MSEEEARARYRYLQLKAKMAESQAMPIDEAPQKSTTQQVLGGLKTAGSAALTALDYPFGILRTGIVAVPRAAKAIYEQDPAQADSMQEDLLNALKGRAPSGRELFQKAGMDEGDKSRILGRDISTRDILGTLFDVGVGFQGSNALKLLAGSKGLLGTTGKILRSPEAIVERGIQAGGKKIYQSGLKAGDFIGKRFGKGDNALSETLLKRNIKGGAQSIADQALEYADELRARQQEILAEASANGVRVDMGKVLAPLKRDVSKIMSETNTLGVKNAAESFGKELDNLIESGSAIPSRVSAETMPKTINSGVGQQGALFGQADLPVARPVKQLAVNADEALRGSTSASPEILATGAGVASKADDLAILEEQLRRAQMSKPQQLDLLNPESGLFNKSELPVSSSPKQAYVNADTPIKAVGPKGQMELLPNAESARVGAPAAYVDESVQYAAQPGQLPLIPESQMLQPGSRVIDPIAEIRVPGREALTVTKASDIKTQLGNQAGDQAYDLFRKSGPGSKLFKRAQNRIKIAVEQSVGRFNKARGAELKEVNRELGNILTSKPVLAAEARKEAMRNAVTSVDPFAASMGLPTLIMKKLADLSKSAGFRTRVGASLYNNPYQYLNATRTGAINVGNGNE